MEAGSRRPNIAGAGMVRDFRGLVDGRSQDVAILVLQGGICDGDAEVGEHQVRISMAGIFADEDIRGFDIAVDDRLEVWRFLGSMGRVALVDEGESFGELTIGVPHEGLRNSGAVFDVGVTEVLEVA